MSPRDRNRDINEGFSAKVTFGRKMPPVRPMQTGGYEIAGTPDPNSEEELERMKRRSSMKALARSGRT